MPLSERDSGVFEVRSWSFGVQISPVRSSRRPHTHTHTHRALSANPFFALSRQGKCPVTRHHGLWLPARGGAFPLSLLLPLPLSPLMKPERRKETAHARLDSNRGDGSPYPSLRDDLGKIYSGNLAPSTDSARYLSASSRRPGGASEGARSIYPLPCPGCCSCPSFDRSPPPSKRSSEKIHRCTRPWAFCLATTTTTCLPVPFSFFCFNISRFLESITPPPPSPPSTPLVYPFHSLGVSWIGLWSGHAVPTPCWLLLLGQGTARFARLAFCWTTTPSRPGWTRTCCRQSHGR